MPVQVTPIAADGSTYAVSGSAADMYSYVSDELRPKIMPGSSSVHAALPYTDEIVASVQQFSPTLIVCVYKVAYGNRLGTRVVMLGRVPGDADKYTVTSDTFTPAPVERGITLFTPGTRPTERHEHRVQGE